MPETPSGVRNTRGVPVGAGRGAAPTEAPWRPPGGEQGPPGAHAASRPPARQHKGNFIAFPQHFPAAGCPTSRASFGGAPGPRQGSFPHTNGCGTTAVCMVTKAFPTKLLVCLSPGFVREIKDPPIKKKKKEEAQKRTLLIASLQNI